MGAAGGKSHGLRTYNEEGGVIGRPDGGGGLREWCGDADAAPPAMERQPVDQEPEEVQHLDDGGGFRGNGSGGDDT